MIMSESSEESQNVFECWFGYETVTHFNIVHVECHMAAVRQARVRLV